MFTILAAVMSLVRGFAEAEDDAWEPFLVDDAPWLPTSVTAE
ncbi:MAG TPA: hypothetical protein VGO60_15125 [Iamia sp.]|nr:hypothetical protein [Iamia sp.]